MRPLKPSCQVVTGHRPAQQIALCAVAAKTEELVPGGFVLDAFRDHQQAEAVAEVDDGADDGLAGAVGPDVEDEGFVDLELVHRELLEVGQGGVTVPKSSTDKRTPNAARRCNKSRVR
jgi:hypothetical protein